MAGRDTYDANISRENRFNFRIFNETLNNIHELAIIQACKHDKAHKEMFLQAKDKNNIYKVRGWGVTHKESEIYYALLAARKDISLYVCLSILCQYNIIPHPIKEDLENLMVLDQHQFVTSTSELYDWLRLKTFSEVCSREACEELSLLRIKLNINLQQMGPLSPVADHMMSPLPPFLGQLPLVMFHQHMTVLNTMNYLPSSNIQRVIHYIANELCKDSKANFFAMSKRCNYINSNERQLKFSQTPFDPLPIDQLATSPGTVQARASPPIETAQHHLNQPVGAAQQPLSITAPFPPQPVYQPLPATVTYAATPAVFGQQQAPYGYLQVPFPPYIYEQWSNGENHPQRDDEF